MWWKGYWEVNERCQKSNYRTVGNWMVRKIERPLAVFVTCLLIRTPVTAHQVTLAAIATAIVAFGFFARGDALGFWIGAVVLQFWYLLDHVDGQIARYRGESSLEGLFFDYLMHHLVSFGALFAVGWGVWRATGEEIWIFVGYLASVSTGFVGLINDCKSKTLFSKIAGYSGRTVRVFIPVPGLTIPAQKAKTPVSPAKRIFSVMHKSCEGHVVLNVLTAGGAIHYFAEKTTIVNPMMMWQGYMLYLAIVSTLVWTGKSVYWILKRKITHESESQFVGVPPKEDKCG